MNFLRINSRFVALPMVALMLALSMPMGAAQAALVGTDRVIQNAEAEFNRARISALFARDDVQQRAESMGVDPAEAAARLDGLSDEEINQIAARLDQLPAGQGVAEALLSAAVLVFLILLFTDLLGLTDVYPFVKGGKGR